MAKRNRKTLNKIVSTKSNNTLFAKEIREIEINFERRSRKKELLVLRCDMFQLYTS